MECAWLRQVDVEVARGKAPGDVSGPWMVAGGGIGPPTVGAVGETGGGTQGESSQSR